MKEKYYVIYRKDETQEAFGEYDYDDAIIAMNYIAKNAKQEESVKLVKIITKLIKEGEL